MATVAIDSFVEELMCEPNWYKTAWHLGLSSECLNLIDNNYSSRGISRCLKEVFKQLETQEGKVLWIDVYNTLITIDDWQGAERIHKKYLESKTTTDITLNLEHTTESDNPDNELLTLFANSHHNHQLLQISSLLSESFSKLDAECLKVLNSFILELLGYQTDAGWRSIIHRNLCFISRSFINYCTSKTFSLHNFEDCLEKINHFKSTISLEKLCCLNNFNEKLEADTERQVTIEFCEFWKEATLLALERLEFILFQNAPFIISAVSEQCATRTVQVTWCIPLRIIGRVKSEMREKSTLIKSLGINSLNIGKFKLPSLSSVVCTFSDCCKTTNVEAIELLLAVFSPSKEYIYDSGLIGIKDGKGKSLLYIACRNGHRDTVELLLDCGADPNLASCDNRTPLIIACHYGHLEIVNLLISKGKVDINRVDYKGKTPLLFHACCMGHDNIVSTLLQYGANPSATTISEKATPLMASSEQGHINVIKLLLSSLCNGFNIDGKNTNKATALVYACEKGHTEVVQLLLDHGSNPNVIVMKTHTCYTPLIIASKNGNAEIVKLLIKANVNLNTLPVKNGGTALYFAAENGHSQVISILLEAGADWSIKRDGRLTPLLAAQHFKHKHCAMLLSRHQQHLPHFCYND